MKVVVFESETREAPVFERLRPTHDLNLVAEPLGPANVERYADAEAISTFIYSKVSREVLERLPALKLIATRSTGYDHIDLASCAERGIAVANVPTYGENTVAEHVFALLLALSHRLIEAVNRARSGEFSPVGLEGFDLEGKTLGVIGTGSIGRHVIRIAKGFGMEVVAFDIKPDRQLASDITFRYAGFDELLARTAPSTPARRSGASSRPRWPISRPSPRVGNRTWWRPHLVRRQRPRGEQQQEERAWPGSRTGSKSQ